MGENDQKLGQILAETSQVLKAMEELKAAKGDHERRLLEIEFAHKRCPAAVNGNGNQVAQTTAAKAEAAVAQVEANAAKTEADRQRHINIGLLVLVLISVVGIDNVIKLLTAMKLIKP